MKAAIDETLGFLYQAVWRLQMSRGKPLTAADIVAIAILKQAAKNVLAGKMSAR